MLLRNLLCSGLLLMTSVAVRAAEPNHFLLLSNAGRIVGKASYTIEPAKGGLRVRSAYSYRLLPEDLPTTANVGPSAVGRGTPGQEAQMHAELKVAADGDLLEGYSENQTNGLMTSYSMDREHKLLISSVQSGVHGLVSTVDMPKPDFVLAALYDPAALQVLVSAARDRTPHNGSFLLAVPRGGSATPVPVLLEQEPDASGTWNGQPCPLKHLALFFGENTAAGASRTAPRAEVYTDGEGRLMEADLGIFGIRYVRAEFKLTPP